jgi:hypothetical protein
MSNVLQILPEAWTWSFLLIVLVVVFHAFGLILIKDVVVERLQKSIGAHRFRILFATVTSTTVLLIAVLHIVEGAVWALAYVLLGALPDTNSSLLFSLNAITSYGHVNLDLQPHWQTMGALESLNGVMIFGLTTAFLFSVLHNVWEMRHVKSA